jgi:hypothetical protein
MIRCSSVWIRGDTLFGFDIRAPKAGDGTRESPECSDGVTDGDAEARNDPF